MLLHKKYRVKSLSHKELNIYQIVTIDSRHLIHGDEFHRANCPAVDTRSTVDTVITTSVCMEEVS